MEYISIFDYPTTKVVIAELPPLKDDEDCMDFIESIDLDSNNSNWMVSDDFPLDLSKSSSLVIGRTIDNIKREMISRIEKFFKEKPETIIEFSERRIIGQEDEPGVLSFEEDSFLWGDGFTEEVIPLIDFCTEDLLYILEIIEEL
jgi:hypothetical protein